MTVSSSAILTAIPSGLLTPLLEEYASIVRNFQEHRWSPSELSGGKFCEIVYTILDGYARGAYERAPSKPSNFVQACRILESNANVPRSFQILVPRLLPALYEIRNNRGVGHVGGDVDPNHMDAGAVLSMTSWIMAELIRVFHRVSVHEAQATVDALVDRQIPLVWQGNGIKRVLDPQMNLPVQILLLLHVTPGPVAVDSLGSWTDCENQKYLRKVLKSLHSKRLAEFDEENMVVQILPPGAVRMEALLKKQDKLGG